tara:strand:+ start:199 stop:756 length:558 start_codon:yes stop_codon:yes gene_type:complete
MKKELLNQVIQSYTQTPDVNSIKSIIPRFLSVVYNVIATTQTAPDLDALASLYPDEVKGVVKYNLERSIRNLHLGVMLSSSEAELPQIAISNGSADFIMGGIPFVIYLNQAQFDAQAEGDRDAVNSIILEEWKDKTQNVNGLFLYKDISPTILEVSQKIQKMIEAQQEKQAEDAVEGTDTEDKAS